MNKLEYSTVGTLDYVIRNLHDRGAVHRKRLYNLGEISITSAAIHMCEEAVEFTAAVCCPDDCPLEDRNKKHKEHQFEEAADLLSCFLHVCYLSGLPLDDIVKRGIHKMEELFEVPQ